MTGKSERGALNYYIMGIISFFLLYGYLNVKLILTPLVLQSKYGVNLYGYCESFESWFSLVSNTIVKMNKELTVFTGMRFLKR